ncbi:heparinase II/III family protein [Salinarimonas soli]|uniref:Heparinase n=1 Tax=Salinarimonas soli TaxID=1638099 RepID=A0A5B2V1Q1_9HYPH|nr:heparinase II/III family protein [Salinarimonas soli]KAA2232139.1 heparinase [Salinarimonas soli]
MRALAARALGRTPMWNRTPARLLIAPPDLRTADPTVADDIYAGYFVFAGRALATGGRTPFDFEPPSEDWGEALCGFGWLRHLRATDTALSRANGRALVDDFISRPRTALARRVAVTTRRVVTFLSQSPLVLDGADHAFYERFMRALGRDVGLLDRASTESRVPLERLIAAIGLAYAGLSFDDAEPLLRRATRRLVREIERQILADGGHASRSPKVLVDLLLDLLPLRQTYVTRGLDPPDALLRAIDRMLPMLRMLRHADGALALVNGMGVTAADHIATLLIYDEQRANPMRHAPFSGYERLQGGATLVIADVGGAPPPDQSALAHAGPLAFELSSGTQRIVVNCGAPNGNRPDLRQAARATAAHSTATVGTLSCADFLAPVGWGPGRWLAAALRRRLGPMMLWGPAVTAERREGDDGPEVRASHDGYRRAAGIVHNRRLKLAAGGTRLEGEDEFVRDPGAAGPDDIAVRFHIHPFVRPSLAEDGRAVLLALPGRETWRFEAQGVAPAIEESVFFAMTDGGRRCEQIVLRLKAGERTTVAWRFERLAA